MFALIAAVALVFAVSLVFGSVIWHLAGYRRNRVLAVPLGFAALLTIAALSIRLPGGATTSAVIVGSALIVSLVFLLFTSARHGVPLWTAPAAAGVVLLAMIPFVSLGRVGLLGVGTNDDMGGHLLAAWTLQGHAPLGSSKLISSGYPIGPHAIAAVISQVTGISLEHAFTGLLVAVPALLALAAAALIPDRSKTVRLIAGAAVGLCYLQTAFLVQASFKEPLESMILVAFAGALCELNRSETGSALRFVPLAVLAAASLYVDSYLGLLWPGGTLLLWLAARTVRRRRRQVRDVTAHPPARSTMIGAALFLVLIAPELPRAVRFSHSAYNHEGATVLGDLLHRLPPLEALGIWPRLDFRFDVPLASPGGVLALLGAVVLVAALIRCVRRGELVIPAALLISAFVFAVTSSRSPYTAAKALVIVAPLATLLIAREGVILWRTAPAIRSRSMAAATLIGVLVIAGAYSDLELLRDGPVGPTSHPDQLAGFGAIIGRQPTLFLGSDDYVHWELRGADLATPPEPLYATTVVPLRRAKAQPDPTNHISPSAATSTSRFAGLGLAFDFDSVPTKWLDRFKYAILPRSGYGSPAPPNWYVVRATTSYELWRRDGRTEPYRTLDAIDNPGAVLDCRTASARAIARETGVALVQPVPVVGERTAWRGSVGYTGRSAYQTLGLGAGAWIISLQYDGAVSVTVHGRHLRAVLPANLEPLGPYWYVGTVRLPRPARVTIAVTYHSLPVVGRLLGARGLTRAPAPTGLQPLGRVTAARPPSADRVIALSRACGDYVDRYWTSGPGVKHSPTAPS